MASVSLKTIEQNDNVSLFSICFEGSEENEFEKFMQKFKDTELSGYVMDLQKFDKVLIEAQKNGTVTIEKNIITDIQSATFNI